jgi:hypothetical protein|tara:strand:- start:77 stop:667 length:591 start_codon:yes stop_codon:yes gene_type:complete
MQGKTHSDPCNTQACPSATIHNDCHYSETSVGGGVAKSELGDGPIDIGWLLAGNTVGNDAISSIKLASGKAALLYKDNMSGGRLLLEESNNCLVGGEWNDAISGMVVFDKSSIVSFYDDCHYAGTEVKLGRGKYGPAMFSELEDKISSVKIPAGITVKVWTNGDFNGPSETLTSSHNCYAGYGSAFNDSISAIEIT